jgi:hypothetical protein
MDLRDELVFNGGYLDDLGIKMGKTAGEHILTLSLGTVLNKTMAEVFGIAHLFVSDTVPHESIKKAVLDDIEIHDAELKLAGPQGDGGIDTFYPEKIDGFTVFKVAGGQLGFKMKAHHSGRLFEVIEFFDTHSATGFSFTIKPRTGSLFEGGTRVNMSPLEESPAPPEEQMPLVAEDNVVGIDEDRSHENRPRGGKRGRKPAAESEPFATDEEPPVQIQ